MSTDPGEWRHFSGDAGPYRTLLLPVLDYADASYPDLTEVRPLDKLERL